MPVQKALYIISKFLKKTTYRHKKKVIALILIALLTYVVKKKVQLMHLIIMANKITTVLNKLPLPQSPSYRQMPNYQHFLINPIIQILQAMKVDEIKMKIKQKKGGWNQLKHSIISGTVLNIILYDIKNFYYTVQNKYTTDFRQLDAQRPFQQLMESVRKKFTNDIQVMREMVQQILYYQIQKIDIRASYSFDQICVIYDNLTQKMFQNHFKVKKQQYQNLQNNIFAEEDQFKIAKNLFMTAYEYLPQSKGKIYKFLKPFKTVFKTLGFRLFPLAELQTTEQRFEWINVAYEISFKKSLKSIQWPNRQSQHLSKMVINEMEQMIQSVNFSTLIFEYSKLNKLIFKNRVKIYMLRINKERIGMAELLSVFYKILKEQMLCANHLDKKQKFYDSQILKSLRLSKKSQAQLKIQQIQNQNKILQQIYLGNAFCHLQKQFQVKYFSQRRGIVIEPPQNKNRKPQQQMDQMKGLLQMLGGNEQLNRTD